MTQNTYRFSYELMEHLKYRRYTAIKNCLIKMDCPSKLVDSQGATLLHYTAKHGDSRTTRYLLDSGFQVDSRDNTGRTPLMYTLPYVRPRTAELLIRYGANIHASDQFGKTALQMVLSSGCKSMGKIFVHQLRRENPTHEALAAVLHSHLEDSLHPVLYLRNAEVTRLLLEKNHSLIGNSARGITCLNLAIELSDYENVKLLIEHGMKVTTCSVLGIYPVSSIPLKNTPRKLEIMKLLYEKGADFSQSGSPRWTPIHGIFLYGTREMVRLMLQANRDYIVGNISDLIPLLAANRNEGVIDEIANIPLKDVNKRNHYDESALDHAVRWRPVSVIEFLLSKGADVNCTSKHCGITALSRIFLSEQSSKSKMQRLKLLLEYGANPQHKFRRHPYSQLTTPLEEAVLVKEMSLAKALVAHIVLRERLLQQKITSETLKTIENDDCLKVYFEMCRKQVEIMDKTNIRASVTLLDLLAKKIDWAACRVKNSGLGLEITRFCNKYRLNPYYSSMLQRRAVEIVKVVNVRREAARICDDIFGHLYNKNDLVIDIIVSFMSCEDLRKVMPDRF